MPDEFEGDSEVQADDSVVAEQTSEPSGSDNPAWTPFLQELPDAYHDIAKKHLRGYDQGVQQRFQTQAEQFAPYKSFVDRGISADDIQTAISFAETVNNNPQLVYDRLRQHLGLSDEQAREVIENAQDGDEDEDGYQQVSDPRIDQLMQAQQALQEQWNLQQEEAERYEVTQSVNTQIDNFQAQHSLPNWEMAEVVQRALQSGATDQQGNPDLAAALDSWNRVKNAIAQGNGGSAPRVISASGGTAAAPQKPFSDMSNDEQKADMVAALRALG